MKTTIKPTDLRTGNKLLFLGKIVTFKNITEIREDGIFWIKTFERIIESKSFHFKPIELTEEVLLKCGFEKRPQSDNFIYFGYGDNPVTHDWILCLKYLKDKNHFFFLNGHHTFQYLHQLQNLYYALTNEELTINF